MQIVHAIDLTVKESESNKWNQVAKFLSLHWYGIKKIYKPGVSKSQEMGMWIYNAYRNGENISNLLNL